MKKLFAIFISSFLLLPALGNAALLTPFFDITVVPYTDGEDGNFNFHIKSYNGAIQRFSQDFSVQTVGGEGSHFTPTTPGVGDVYYITEDVPEGWQLSDIYCSSANPDFDYTLIANGVRIVAIPYSTINCSFYNIPANQQKTPVLIVPGVLGTDIKKGSDILWANPIMAIPGNSDDFMDPLQFKEDLTPLDNSLTVDKVIGEKPLFDYTKSLIEEFAGQDYIENQDLFTFPYDWRYGVSGKYGDNTDNVDKLKEKIDEILSQTGASKVDVIAHSTGGLLLKKYIMDNPESHHVNKAVMVGVPNLGAAKAVKVLVAGDGFDIFGLNDEEMKKISENMPVVYDLSPTRKLYDIKGSFVKVIEQKFLARDIVKDLNFDEARDYLLNDHGLNGTAYQNTQNLQTDAFVNYDMRSAGADVYNIVGCKAGTIGQIVEKRSKKLFGSPLVNYLKPQELTGDETVPFESADSILADDDQEYYAKQIKHSSLLSANGSRQLIVNLITGSDLSTGNKIITKQSLLNDIKQCELKGKSINIQSPLAIEVFDNVGNRLGFAEDGSLQNDIPGADFNVFGDHKFVYLPEEGASYTFNFTGTGDGTFTLGIDDIDENQTTQSQNFINIPVSTTTLGTLEFVDGLAQLSLDDDGDGTTDHVFNPNSILDANQSQDLIAPISTSTLTGLMGSPGFYRSNVSITLSAVDPIIEGQEDQTSGIFKTLLSIDGEDFQEYTGTTTITSEGNHTLEFYSVDNAGNNETTQSLEINIDKTAPEFRVSFSLSANDFVFKAVDSDVPPQCSAKDCIAVDEAGNESKITFQKSKLLTLRSLALKKIEQNGQVLSFPDNLLVVNNLNLNGQLRDFNQTVLIKKQELGRVDYVKKKDISNITEFTKQGFKRYSLPGVHYLEIQTNKNNIITEVK